MNILNDDIINDLIKNEPDIKGCKFKKMHEHSSCDIAINNVIQKPSDNSIIFNVNKNYILKIQKEPKLNEIIYQIKASKEGLSPVIHEVYECKIGDKIKSYAFIMDELDISAKEYILDKNKELSSKIDVLKQIIEKLTKLNEIGIRHNDSLLRNFMLKSGVIYIIDFDQSLDIKESLYRNDFNMLHNDLIDELCPEGICNNNNIELLKDLLQTLTGYTNEKTPSLQRIPKSIEEQEEEKKELEERQKRIEKRIEKEIEEKKEMETDVQKEIKHIFDKKNISTVEDYNDDPRIRLLIEKKLKNYENIDINKEIEKALRLHLIS
jgi:hypothetical protein